MTSSIAIQGLVDVCRRQHKSLSTERTYAIWLKDYCRFVARLDPALTSERKLEAFLTVLARQRNVSASTQNQAFNAIIFFYKSVLGQPLKDVDALRATRPDQIRLRHSYATHCIERGTNIKALSEAMGHAQIETTARYCHAGALSVRSPLEAIS